MKPLLKPIRRDVPLLLDQAWCDRLDHYAAILSQSRSGMARFMIRLSAPIVEKLCQVIPEKLRETCARLDGSDFLDLPRPTVLPLPRGTTLDDERRQSEPSGRRRQTEVSRRSQSSRRKADAKGQAHASGKAGGNSRRSGKGNASQAHGGNSRRSR